MKSSSLRNLLVSFGVVAPLIYFALWAAATTLFPGYDHATRMVSELGGPEAPHPDVFNVSLIAAGGLTVLAAVGFAWALVARGGSAIAAGLAGLATAAFGVSFVMGGLFPLPDERHLAWGLGFATHAAPLFVLWALARERGLGLFKGYLWLNLAAGLALLAVMFGVGDLVGRDNLGLWQRAYGLTIFPWTAATALVLLRAPAERRIAFGFAPA